MARPTRAQSSKRKAGLQTELEDGGALVQGIEILRMLQDEQRFLTQAAISNLLSCSESRAERLLSTLTDFKLIQKKNSSEYQADIGLLQLCRAGGSHVKAVRVFEQSVSKFLGGQQMRANLYVADKSTAVCLAALGIGSAQELGRVIPLSQGALGHTLIWGNEIKQRHALMEEQQENQDEAMSGFLESAYLSFHRLEQRGYCWSSSEDQLSCFAPIEKIESQPESVIGLSEMSGNKRNYDERTLGELTLQIANALSESILN